MSIHFHEADVLEEVTLGLAFKVILIVLSFWLMKISHIYRPFYNFLQHMVGCVSDVWPLRVYCLFI